MVYFPNNKPFIQKKFDYSLRLHTLLEKWEQNKDFKYERYK